MGDRWKSFISLKATAAWIGYAAWRSSPPWWRRAASLRAARLLHLSPAAVTRAIAALEERLGVRLLNRTTRSLGLTEPGLGYLASIRRLLADLDEAEQVGRRRHGHAPGASSG